MAKTRNCASYPRAVEWLALNDEGLETDEEVVATLVTTLLVADLWAKEPIDVARDVLKSRRNLAA